MQRLECHFPTLSPWCPIYLRISCPKALTNSLYCNPYGLMYKIPIILHPPNMSSTGGTELLLWFSHWCWLSDSCPSQWLSLGICTGWVLGQAGKGGAFQARPPADQGVGAVLMCRLSAPHCSALSSQHSWVCVAISLVHYSAQTNKAQLPSQHAGMVSLGTD